MTVLSRTLTQLRASHVRTCVRMYSSDTTVKAMVYSEYGKPSEVLKHVLHSTLPFLHC